ncbi:MAG: ATP-binding protein [Mangrovibacterium sp.]
MISTKEQNCHPYIDPDTCIWCGVCEDVCPVEAIKIHAEDNYTILWYECICCWECKHVCPVDAIRDIND